jgi:hypothetical protein
VAKEERIAQYVQRSTPQFRHLLKHRRQSLDTISPNLEAKLDVELYRIDQGYQHDMQSANSRQHAGPSVTCPLRNGPDRSRHRTIRTL